MRRRGFTRRTVQFAATGRQWDGDNLPTAREVPLRISDGKARMCVPLPKEAPYRSEAYRRLVAAMPCAHCQRPGPSQCAHGDEGKGMGIKASDLTCYPLCADAPGRLGCHSIMGASGTMPRELRRELEKRYAEQTRHKIGRPA